MHFILCEVSVLNDSYLKNINQLNAIEVVLKISKWDNLLHSVHKVSAK